MADLHPTIDAFLKVVQSGKKEDLIPLLAEENVGKINPFYKIFSVIEYLIFGTSLNEAS